ncbi:MAG: FAD-dependent oxidoreductase [candidate division KSB1 bacterium]|nr:FAD-dependent oxidoreductase [candidate division KSB1 bacterium]
MERREVDFMIVGQGLAGSQLAAMLRREGRSVLVVDNGNPAAASRVNLGVMNPVTGRKLKLAWKVDQVFPFAEEWYRSLERELSVPLFEKKNLIRFFIDEKQKRVWEEKRDRPEFQPYLAEPQQWEAYLPFVHAPLGGIEITGAALVNVEGLLSRWRQILRQEGALIEATLNLETLNLKMTVWCGGMFQQKKSFVARDFGLSATRSFRGCHFLQ